MANSQKLSHKQYKALVKLGTICRESSQLDANTWKKRFPELSKYVYNNGWEITFYNCLYDIMRNNFNSKNMLAMFPEDSSRNREDSSQRFDG